MPHFPCCLGLSGLVLFAVLARSFVQLDPVTSRVHVCFKVDLKTKAVSQMRLPGLCSSTAAGLQPGCHVGRSPVPAFADQNSRWFMLLILSCLDCVCSESRDVNTRVHRGSEQLLGCSVGQHHCSASLDNAWCYPRLRQCKCRRIAWLCCCQLSINLHLHMAFSQNLSLGLQSFLQ